MDLDSSWSLFQLYIEHSDNVIKKWGNSEQWVLELWDGRRVEVPFQISLPPGEVVGGLDVSNQLAMVLGVSLESKEIISEQEKGDDVVVEDWVSDICSEDAFQCTVPLLPLTVEPLAYSLPMDNGDGSATLVVKNLLGKDNYSEWFQEKFSGFDDFLRTSLKGLEEPATNFLLVVEAELQQRAFKEKIEQTVKSSGRKGITELRGLFSFVNYGSTSIRRIGNGKERAFIISQ